MESRRRLKVLFVSPSLPWPLDEGFSIRVYHLMRGVSVHHDVSLVAHGRVTPAAAPVSSIARVHLVPPPRRSSRLRSLSMLLLGRSRPRQRQRTATLAEAVARQAQALHPDIIQWETPFLVGGPVNGALQVLDEHNVWSELLARRRTLQRSHLRRALFRVEERVIAGEEKRTWAHADASLFTSEREARIARAAGARNAVVVPNGVDVDSFVPSTARERSNELLFVGLLSYGPNWDAVNYFVDELLPRLEWRGADVRLTLIGRDAPQKLVQRLGPRIRYLGRVPDIRPHLERATAVIAPLRYGSGTRIKILEAMAAARPVVATSCAVEGLDVTHLEHLLIADDPDAFADCILRVLGDAALARRLGENARRLVERCYSWRSITDNLVATYDTLLRDRAGHQAHAGVTG